MSTPLEIEYLKLWMEQSKLFWSRLQSAAVLHTAVLAGWYTLGPTHPRLRCALLFLGLILSVFLLAIMVRDARYLDSLRGKVGALHFPYTGSDNPKGRDCGYIIVGILMVAEVALMFRSRILDLLRIS